MIIQTWLLYIAAARIVPRLRTPGRALAFNRAAGATFIGAGALLATIKRG